MRRTGRLHWLIMMLACGSTPAALGAQDSPAHLVVVVTDHLTSEPLAGVRVRLTSAGMDAATDGRGRATLTGIRPGTHILLIQRLGYAPESAAIDFTSGATVEADVPLRMVPAKLDEVAVTEQRQNPSLDRTGFYRRQRENGFGTFIGEEEIENRRKRGATVLDILRNTRGIAIDYSYRIPVIYTSRGQDSILLGRCKPLLYIDGILFRIPFDERGRPMASIDQVVVLDHIAAIEVYPSGASAPPGLGGGSGCGAVAIWTRQG